VASLTGPVLERLFGAEGLEEFAAAHWPERTYVRHGGKSRLPEALLAEPLNDFHSLARRYKGVVSFFSGPDGPHMVPVDGVNPAAPYQLGLSVYLYDVAPFFPALEQLLRGLEAELGVPEGAARAGVFASPRESGISCHFDAVDVFSIQLRGSKRFRLAPVRELPAPWGNQYIPGSNPADDLYVQAGAGLPDWRDAAFETVEMTPGTVLYMPRGTWHLTEVGEDSLSVSIGISPPAVLECVLEQLRLVLLQDPRWRKPFYGAWGDGPARERAIEEARALLGELPETLPTLRPEMLVLPALSEERRVRLIDAESRFQRTPNTSMALEHYSETEAAPGAEPGILARIKTTEMGVERVTATVDMPTHYAPVLAWMAERRAPFAARELATRFDALDLGEHCELLSALTRSKFLKLLWFPPNPHLEPGPE